MRPQPSVALGIVLLFASLTAVPADSSSDGVSTSADALISGIQIADMNTAVRAQDDLFEYANGTWLREVPIPADRSSYGVDSMMIERSLLQQRELIESARTAIDPEARQVGDLYTSFMDETRIEHEGVKPLKGSCNGSLQSSVFGTSARYWRTSIESV